MDAEATRSPLRALRANRWGVLALVMLIAVAVSGLQAAPAALGPLLIPGLGINRAQLGLLASAIWAGTMLGNYPMGVLIDRYGERRITLLGVGSMAVVLGVASLQSSFLPVLVLFLVSSVGAASSGTGGSRSIAAHFGPGQRGMAMGVRQTGVMIGGLIASLVLPPLAARAGWRFAFQAAVVAALLLALIYFALYLEPATPPGRRRGTGLRTLLHDRTFLLATAFALVFLGTQGTGTTYLPTFIHEVRHLDTSASAAFLAVLQAGGVAGRLAWGLVSDRTGDRARVLILVGGLGALAAAGLALSDGSTPILVVAALCFLAGTTWTGWNALYLTLISEVVPLHSAATAVGAGLTIAYSATFVVSPAFGFAVDQLGSYRWPWLGLAAWCGIGTGAAVALYRSRRTA